MAFLLRKPFIYLVIGIIVAVILLYYTGSQTPTPATVTFASAALSSSTITLNTTTNLTATIQNRAPTTKTVELRILYGTPNLLFYDKINSTLLSNQNNGTYYIVRYPKTTKMLSNEQWTIGIIIKGLDSGSLSNTYNIILELYADNQFSQTKTISLTINRT